MAVQKSKKSRSKRDSRRAHDSLKGVTLSTDSTSGERHLRHNISPEGHYRGKKFTLKKEKQDETDSNLNQV